LQESENHINPVQEVQEEKVCVVCGKTEAELGLRLLKGLDGCWYCKVCYRDKLKGTTANQVPSPMISASALVGKTSTPENQNEEDDNVKVVRKSRDEVDEVSLKSDISKITGKDKDEAINSLLQQVKQKRSGDSIKEILETKMESVWSQKGRELINNELYRVPYLTFLNYFVLDLIEACIQPEHIVLSVLNLDVKNKEDKLLMRYPMLSDLLDSLPWTFFLENTKNICMVIDVVLLRLEEFKLSLTKENEWIDPEANEVINVIEGFYTEFKHRSNAIYDKLEIVSDSPEEINKMLTGVAAFLPRLGAIESRSKGTETISYAEAYAALKPEEKREIMIENFLDFNPDWFMYIKDDHQDFLKKLFTALLPLPSSKLTPLDVMQIAERWDDVQRRKFITLFMQTLTHAEKVLVEEQEKGQG
jgi:hypothetical protein